jgi:hypothetical protein
MSVLLQVFRHMFGEQNVAGITAIHHPLGHVDARAGNIGAAVHIGHFAHRPAVNSHPHRYLRVGLERLRNLERALRRFLRTIAKDQRHPVARWQSHELLVGRRNCL